MKQQGFTLIELMIVVVSEKQYLQMVTTVSGLMAHPRVLLVEASAPQAAVPMPIGFAPPRQGHKRAIVAEYFLLTT